jgi:hypothetical protein
MGMPDFRFGGKGGWNNRGNVGSSGKAGMHFQVNFNQIQLTRMMLDMKLIYPREFKEILKAASIEAQQRLVADGKNIKSQTKNQVYGVIADSLSIRELQTSQGSGGGWRIYAAPEGSGPGGSHGKDPIKSFSKLYSKPHAPWAYGFELHTNKNQPVISSSKWEHKSNFTLMPILLKADSPLMFPGIGDGSRPVWNWVEDGQKYIREGTEERIRHWLKNKFNTMSYRK